MLPQKIAQYYLKNRMYHNRTFKSYHTTIRIGHKTKNIKSALFLEQLS